MYLIVYNTSNGLKCRYLTTHIFLNPGDITPGGWLVLSVGYYHNKKFIGKDEFYQLLQKHSDFRFKTLKIKSSLNRYYNFVIKILLSIFLLKEIIYKFFIYIIK